MTALDQAFIKAYMQQGAAPAAALESVRPVSLADALGDQPTPQSIDAPDHAPDHAPAEVSIDGVLEALQRAPTGGAGPATFEPPPRDAGDEEPGSDQFPNPAVIPFATETALPFAAEMALPPFVRAGSIDAQTDPVEAAPVLEGLNSVEAVHNVDPGDPTGTGARTENRADPLPHVGATTFDATEHPGDPPADADTPAAPDEISDADAAGQEAFAGDRSFQPMLQVDHFTWPSACRRLGEMAALELDRLADGLVAAMARGHKVIGIGSCRSGDGATTMALCAGQCLVERGKNVVLVDGNLANPQLGKRLGLLPQSGWEEVLAGRLPLGEVVIESTRNQFAVLPVCGTFAGTGGPCQDEARVADSLQMLAASYDVVLVDLGPLEDPDVVGGSLARGIASRLHAIVLVQNVHATSEEQLVEIQGCLAATDIARAGIIQNFVRD